MVFDVATLVSIISEAMTLRSGDIIVTGTPSGVGASRKPQLWMRPGDCGGGRDRKNRLLVQSNH